MMTTITLDLAPDLFARLRAEAARQGKPAQALAQEWLVERLAASPPDGERARVRSALRAAGLLDTLTPEELERAARSDATLDEVSAALDRSAGEPLSAIVLAQRGPKG